MATATDIKQQHDFHAQRAVDAFSRISRAQERLENPLTPYTTRIELYDEIRAAKKELDDAESSAIQYEAQLLDIELARIAEIAEKRRAEKAAYMATCIDPDGEPGGFEALRDERNFGDWL